MIQSKALTIKLKSLMVLPLDIVVSIIGLSAVLIMFPPVVGQLNLDSHDSKSN